MPADQLNLSTTTCAHDAQTAAAMPNEMAEGVLVVLAGSSLDQVVAELGWYQVHVQFSEWVAAKNAAATGLGPRLQRLQDTGVIAAWWFIREAPCWRLRMKPGHDVERAEMKTSANSILDGLMTAGLISRWQQTRYEPETVAFGGRSGMDIAHDLFCSDSRTS